MRLCFLVSALSLDAVDMDSKQSVAALNAFHRVIAHPAPCVCLRANENRRYGRIFQFPVDQSLEGNIACFLRLLPN